MYIQTQLFVSICIYISIYMYSLFSLTIHIQLLYIHTQLFSHTYTHIHVYLDSKLVAKKGRASGDQQRSPHAFGLWMSRSEPVLRRFNPPVVKREVLMYFGKHAADVCL